MAWESRGNNQYYYASERVNGRVTKRYLGRGGWIGAMEALDGFDRRRREEEARQAWKERRKWQEEDAAVKAFCQGCGRLAELYLNGCGYFRHDRGAYRKRRFGMTVIKDECEEGMAIESAWDRIPETKEERVRIIRAAIRDKDLEPLAIACIQKHPGELIANTLSFVRPVLDRNCGDNKVIRAMMQSEVDKKRKELLGQNPSPLERLLVERVLATQVHLARIELWYGTQWENGGNIKQGAFWEKRLESAQRLYLQAVKALAEVRKLQTPSVAIALPGSTQVTHVDKQLNILQAQKSQKDG